MPWSNGSKRGNCQLTIAHSGVVELGRMPDRSAIVIGGGLAGIVIARELALRRWRVILLEKSKRLGGKAGAEVKDGRPVEHGYHVFPKWYPNVRAILDRIGVRLIDFD